MKEDTISPPTNKQPQIPVIPVIKNDSTSLEMLNLVMTETLGMSMHNAVTAQQNAQMLNTAIITSTCSKILSVIGVKIQPVTPAEPKVKQHVAEVIHQSEPDAHDAVKSNNNAKKSAK